MHVCLFMYVCLYASSYVIGAVCFTCHNIQILTGKSKSAKINFLCCRLDQCCNSPQCTVPSPSLFLLCCHQFIFGHVHSINKSSERDFFVLLPMHPTNSVARKMHVCVCVRVRNFVLHN